MIDYAELHCLSDFSFQRGASSALELFERARDCGYTALAITDECSLAGIVRAWEASRDTEVPLIVGTEVQLADGPKLVLLAENKQGYVALCRLITQGRRSSEKGSYRLSRSDLAPGMPGTLALWIPEREPHREYGAWTKQIFGDRAWLAVELHHDGDDETRLRELEALGESLRMPRVACGDVHMHVRKRLPLQHTMTAIRHHMTIAEAGAVLFRNGERHLRKRSLLEKIYPAALLDESVRIAKRCTFSLQELHYQYPKELVPEGYTAMQWLRHRVAEGVAWRWPGGIPGKLKPNIEHELRLIEEKKYEAFFLTVDDIVRYARNQGILSQGRGSAANSIVCFVLGITDAHPEKIELLVERFISVERDEPPDIDVDFEHERREEVIQYVYNKYGRERAAIAATVISYRAKSAVRDVAKALGLPEDQIDKLSRIFFRLGDASLSMRLREQGFDPDAPVMRKLLALTAQLLDKPRHLSQHVGGFVIHDAPLHELVPVENAAMPNRTIIQWDKDDLDTMRLLKVDCLALGMLTCLRKCFDLVKKHRGRALSIATIEPDDDDTYDMIQRADTIGVFQIESRAQMAMLPRLKPENYYDLVIQIAIVRPGPIQGDMVHPYLRRRRKEEPIVYPSEELEPVLERTKGVPLFQEQVMKLAMVAAGYTPGEADQLRRAMGAWKRHGGMEKHREKLIAGMTQDGKYTQEFAEQIFNQIKGFGSYGFPESHAASFANLAYTSSWLKCHEPAAYACALLNAQPMGFYGPSQIVQDAQRHNVRVRPVDVRYSDWDCTLEPDPRSNGGFALRLGFRQLRGCNEAVARRIAAAREAAPFRDVVDLCARAELDPRHQDLLADAGALRGLAGHRHRALWLTSGVESQLPLFGRDSPCEQDVALPPPTPIENLTADYAHSGLSLGAHPLRLLRHRLRAHRYLDSRELQKQAHASHVRTVGLVTQRQQPQTASGVTFITIEDEFGPINVVVWNHIAQTQRRPYLEARLLAIEGRWEAVDGVSHLIARKLRDLSGLLADLDARSRDFH